MRVALTRAGTLGGPPLSRRERMVMVEPRGTGMALFTLRAADEVRPAQFGNVEGEVDAEMVAIAKAIIAGGAIGRPDVVARFQVWGRTWPLHRNASLTEGREIIAVRDVMPKSLHIGAFTWVEVASHLWPVYLPAALGRSPDAAALPPSRSKT